MAKKVKEKQTLFCRDCKHSYDYHEKNHKGEFFLCKCPFFKYSRFLNRDYCNEFKRKY